MALLREYHRPSSLAEALALLQTKERRLVPLAGGTTLVGELETRQRTDIDGVVDLRDLGLNQLLVRGDVLHLGATATLTDVIEHLLAGSLADGLLQSAARGEGAVNLRNAATVGGIVAASAADSEFYAALLALAATVTIYDGTALRTVPLAELTWVEGLITEVQVPVQSLRGGHSRVARTPSDRPIVAALAVRSEDGERVALCGVGPQPLLLGSPLDPAGDYKGSAAYRQAMAEVVRRRALAQIRRHVARETSRT